MNAGKIITVQHSTHHPSINDKKSYSPVHLLKNTGRTGGKVKPQDKDSSRLQEQSLMNNTYFGAIHFDIHLDLKLDYTICTVLQEMSFRI